MIKIILAVISLFLFSCSPAGTLKKVDKGNGEIEVYAYYYHAGFPIYVARFKDQPNVVTTTWQAGKTMQSCVTVYEDEKVQVILKK